MLLELRNVNTVLWAVGVGILSDPQICWEFPPPKRFMFALLARPEGLLEQRNSKQVLFYKRDNMKVIRQII